SLPEWWKGPGFAGLVAVGEDRPDVLRAVWREKDAFLALDLPMDRALFTDFEKRLGIRLLTAGGRVGGEGEGVRIDLGGSEGSPAPSSGFNFVALIERTVWA